MPSTSINSSLELTSAITVLANAITCNLTLEQITLLASLLVQLSDTLNTIVARETLCANNRNEG